MPSPLFYIFATLMIVGALMVVFMRNPVSSALSMVLSFIGLAALFIGINAYFVGIIQVLVYAGAIMVLFIFIIMLLDLQKEESHPRRAASIAAGVFIPLILIVQLVGVLTSDQESPSAPKLELKQAAANFDEGTMIHKRLADQRLPDTHLIGRKIFTEFNFPLQIIAVLLLVATVGCVALSKKATVTTVKSPSKRHIPKVESSSVPQVKAESTNEQKPS